MTKLLSHYPNVPHTPETLIPLFAALKQTMFPTVQPLPGVARLLNHLHRHRISMAVATSSKRVFYNLKTSHLGELFGLFEGKVICADDRVDGAEGGERVIKEGRGKPAPDIYLTAAQKLLNLPVTITEDPAQITPEEASLRARGLVFEDAIPGVEAGQRAGMAVVWVPDAELLAVQRKQGLALPEVDEMILSMEDFVPEQWGLPPYDDENVDAVQ
jgi:pseudouridine-5'-monophosphatase